MDKLFIIGSKSFIAKNLMNYIDKKKFKIFKVQRPKFDLTKKKSLKKLKDIIDNNSTILFVAAKAPVKSFSEYYYNIKILNNFLGLISNIDIKHFYYVSSDAVYSDSKSKINEQSKTEPKNLHGLMHLNRENIIKNKYFNNCSFLRPTLVYGPGDKHLGYGPNKFIHEAISKKSIKLFGKGEELRDHIYIDDLSKIASFIINNNIKGNYNLVTGQLISFYKISKSIRKKMKSDITIDFLKRTQPMPHNGYRAFDNKKIFSLMNDFKFINFNDSIKKYLKSIAID